MCSDENTRHILSIVVRLRAGQQGRFMERLQRLKHAVSIPGSPQRGRRKRPHPSSQPRPPLRDDSASLLVSYKPSPAPTDTATGGFVSTSFLPHSAYTSQALSETGL